MFRTIILAAACSFAVNSSMAAELHFSDYAVQTYKGKIAAPRYVGERASARNYRTRIKNGLAGGVNFAGHYTLIEIGCGSSCIFGFLVDAMTGEILDFPLGGEENYQLQLTYHADSRLLRAVWKDTEASDRSDTCRSQDFVMEGKKLQLVNEHEFKVEEFGFCS